MTELPEPPPSHQTLDYPVVLHVGGRKCLVVGGGSVAARKARGLLAAGARVTVVAPVVNDAVVSLTVGARGAAAGSGHPSPSEEAPTLGIERRPYEAGEAARYDLVATATGRPEVDRAVVADAVAAGVLVNSADGASPGTIQLPAVHRDGPVTVAVSTGGASPALARWLRDRAAASIPPGVATIAVLLDEARVAMRQAGVATESVDWTAVLDQQVAPLVAAGRIDDARAALRATCLPPRPG
jgi:precorrin-2 dehydrogenase / sirohydrochlorin ferrochelatase